MASLSSISSTIPLRAPGVFLYPDAPLFALTGVRMDVCAFAGVAPRGPARVPVVNEQWSSTVPQTEPGRPINRTQAYVVESFSAYQQLYGGFEGPGLLPYAVASFFEQGGARAYIARIVHDYGAGNAGNTASYSSGTLLGAATPGGPLLMRAANEGSWGNLLQAQLSFSTNPIYFDAGGLNQLIFDIAAEVSRGETLRLTLADGSQVLRVITTLFSQPNPAGPGSQLLGVLESPLAAAPVSAEVVTASLEVDDGAGNTEQHLGLGLSSEHPRWMATVLCNESVLLFPDVSWSNLEIVPDSVTLTSVAPLLPQFQGGKDAWADIVPSDFFDSGWGITDEDPGQGVQCLAQLEDLSLLAVPDLYSPQPITTSEDILDPVSLAGPDFAICVDAPSQPPQGIGTVELLGLQLDPLAPADLLAITGLQQQLVAFAEAVQQFVVLLDVPPGITQTRILNWRTAFNSTYAACYHPWVKVSRRDGANNLLCTIPPSAVAAGIIAVTALQFGVPTGPANVLGVQVVDVTDVVSRSRHDQLHPLGINVYLRDRDGVRLTAARTLSRNPQYRQLTVRRLITLLRLTLYRQMQWAVFEPNNAALRLEIQILLTNFLRALFRQGAFSGSTEATSFFVRCDATNNPPYLADTGMLIAEIGVAPTEPIEFIMIRLSRGADGTLSIQD